MTISNEAASAEDGPTALLLVLHAMYSGAASVYTRVFRTAVEQHLATGSAVDSSPLHLSAQMGAQLLQAGAFLGVSAALTAGEDILISSLHSDTFNALVQLAEGMQNARVTQACYAFLRSNFAQLVYPLSTADEGGLTLAEVSNLARLGVFMPPRRCKVAPDGTAWPVDATSMTMAFVPDTAPRTVGPNAKQWTAEHLTVGRLFKNAHGTIVGWTPLHPSTKLPAECFKPQSAEAVFQNSGNAGGNASGAAAQLQAAALGAECDQGEYHFVPPVAELSERHITLAVLDAYQQADESTVLQGLLHWGKHAAFVAAQAEADAAGKVMKRKGNKFLRKRLSGILTQSREVSVPSLASLGAAPAGDAEVQAVRLADCVRSAFVPSTSAAMQTAVDLAAISEEAAVAAMRFTDVHNAESAEMRLEAARTSAEALTAVGNTAASRWEQAPHFTAPRAWCCALASCLAETAQALATHAATATGTGAPPAAPEPARRRVPGMPGPPAVDIFRPHPLIHPHR